MSGSTRTCPSCRVRWQITPPARHYNNHNMTLTDIRYLESRAAEFDELSGRYWSAAEFVAWLRPEIIGKREAA